MNSKDSILIKTDSMMVPSQPNKTEFATELLGPSTKRNTYQGEKKNEYDHTQIT